MSEKIIFEYEAAQTHLNEMNVPTTKGLAELSLWGRVSAALDDKDSRIAALEADKKRLVEALEQAANALQEKLIASAGEWATGDVAHDYAVKLVAPYRALLSEVS